MRLFKLKVVPGLVVAFFAISVIFYVNASAQESKDDIVDVLTGGENFKTLVKLWDAAALTETLKGEGSFTVFAPTDEAFAKLPEEALNNLLKPENVMKLRSILTYHIAEGKLLSADLANLKSTQSLNGQEITVAVQADTVMVDNTMIKQSDIECRNGVIHIIDTVLFPEEKEAVKEME